MSRRVKVISVWAAVSLVLPLILNESAVASTRAVRQRESYTLSAEAVEAAGRFRRSVNERVFADLEIVLKELTKTGGKTSADGPVEYQSISKPQLRDLLGPPAYEGEKGEITYNHSFGTTTIYFEGDRLKEAITMGRPNFWYEYPRQGTGKRLWYGTKRWARKIIRLIF